MFMNLSCLAFKKSEKKCPLSFINTIYNFHSLWQFFCKVAIPLSGQMHGVVFFWRRVLANQMNEAM